MGVPLSAVPRAPGRVPLAGNVPALLRRRMEFIQSLRTIGDMVRVDIGTWPVYFVTSSDLIHQVLVTNAGSFQRGRLFDRARPVFGTGLGTMNGEEHRRRRRLMQPVFQRSRITGYTQIMGDCARAETETWTPGETLDVDDAMYSQALTTVARTMFSADLARPAIEEVRRWLPVLVKDGVTRALLPRSMDRWPIGVNRRFNTAATRLRAVIDKVVEEYRVGEIDNGDLLSVLMAARDPETGQTLSDTQLRDELVTIMVGGTETTALTLAWTFHELGRHPEVERRLHEEVDSVVGTRPIEPEDLPRLGYTTRVLNETLRLHSLLVFMRRAAKPVEIGGVDIPPGTEIGYSLYALHHDPRLFTDPDRFDPDRWLPERSKDVPRNAYIPFSAGSHKCMGDGFASIEMVISLATIVARWRLLPVPGHVVREMTAALPRPQALPMIPELRHVTASERVQPAR
ncbi:cytochrome P450 [Actinomadura sp. DC4]|uniref:cytochrome P450 n=1 Tax=Actinomadura sp. DC4 TaxID=3055069 RepID=UPI0025B013F2|nr:cytochrome P450 [Actinomadura sp. DC4]MDN3354420.1 cytochrome P450 [Actinomadura sp. DC4]